jgi:hypothetical protein
VNKRHLIQRSRYETTKYVLNALWEVYLEPRQRYRKCPGMSWELHGKSLGIKYRPTVTREQSVQMFKEYPSKFRLGLLMSLIPALRRQRQEGS